jgi:signal transduction histidine kinase
MTRIQPIEQAALRSRWLPAAVITLSLLVLAGVVMLGALQARQRIREVIAGRDADVLHAVALLHYAEDVRDGLAGPTLNFGDPLSIALKSAELRGVLGVRLFDPEGNFVESFPLNVIEENLPAKNLAALKSLRPFSRYHPHAQMAALFYPDETAPTNAIPLLEVCVPLHAEGGSLAGIAQFLVEGHGLAAEFARLDRLLATQALLAFTAGGTILAVALAWAFRRLRRAHQLLTQRTGNLARANQELALAAKTSALGAVAAHLIHGLKNPLAGLQNFVAARGLMPESSEAADWDQAVASTRRMQTMINQVVGVLREEQAGTAYEVTLIELESIVRNRVQPLAREHGVGFTSVVQAQAALPNRVANLVALILVNLAENAVQATSGGKAVNLSFRRIETRLVLEVRDEGSGFPADTPLFMPCRSAKEGGTGIGLALCKQLANHLGAELELTTSTPAGCVFALSLTDPRQTEVPAKTRLPEKDQVEGM